MMQHWQKVKDGGIAIAHNARDLWDAALDYFHWCDTHPIDSPQMIRGGKSAAETICMKMPRPYTMQGFCLHANITPTYLYDMISGGVEDEYYFVAQKIVLQMQAQKLEYAYVGVFNPVIAAKEMQIGGNENVERSPIIQITNITTDAPKLLNDEPQNIERAI